MSTGAEVVKTIVNTPEIIGVQLNTNGKKEDIGRQMVVAALYANNGNRTKAAKQLGISRRTIHRQLDDLGLDQTRVARSHKSIKKPPSIYHEDNDYFKMIEKEGSKAIQIMDLENEVTLLRAHTLEMLKKFRDGTATGGFDRLGGTTEATDVQKAAVITQLAKTIAVVRKTDYDILRDTVITLANHKIWLAKLAAEIKAEFPDIESQKKFCLAAARAGEPIRGGESQQGE